MAPLHRPPRPVGPSLVSAAAPSPQTVEQIPDSPVPPLLPQSWGILPPLPSSLRLARPRGESRWGPRTSALLLHAPGVKEVPARGWVTKKWQRDGGDRQTPRGGQEPGSRPHCRRQNQGLLETGAPAEALPRWVICKTEEEEGGAVAGQAGFTRLLPAPTLCAARGPRQPVACPSGGTWKMRISRPPPAPTVPLTSTSPPWFPPGPVATLSTLSFLLPSHSSLFLSPVIAFPSPSYTHKDPSRKAR